MNKIIPFLLLILCSYYTKGDENPAILLVKNSNGALTFRVSLKTEGKIKVDWGDNNLKEYDANAASRAEDATMVMMEDVKKNTEIKIYGKDIRLFSCTDQFLSSLDVKNARELATLSCTRNYLKELDLSNNRALRSINCYANKIKSLDLSNNTRITYLNCSYNYIRDISIEKNTSLTYLNVADNHLRQLKLDKHKSLKQLYVSGNRLSSIDIRPLAELQHLDVSYNKFSVCTLNKIFTDIREKPKPKEEEEKKSEKKDLIILHNRGFIKSNTAIATAKNWIPDTNGNGSAKCK